MELKKQPKTQEEYWEIIEGLGGFIHSTNRGLNRGRIPNDEGVQNTVFAAQKTLAKLVKELDEKFDIIFLSGKEATNGRQKPDNFPEGKIWYWDWYEDQKSLYMQNEYQKIICSACPLSEGVKNSYSSIPCSVFRGVMYRLRRDHECGMLDYDWTREKLVKEISEKGGEKAVEAFVAKEKELTPVPAAQTAG